MSPSRTNSSAAAAAVSSSGGREDGIVLQSSSRAFTVVDWPAKVSAAIQHCHLSRVSETPTSAAGILHTAESFCQGNALSIDVERTLFEAFVEDDYEGMLHLLTLRNEENNEIVGLVFWREVPDDEIKSWINFEALSASISKGLVMNDNGDENENDDGKCKRHSRASLVSVREESLHWLYQASASNNIASLTRGNALNRQDVIDGLVHCWVKIELLAVKQPFWGNGYGSLLLACALYEAYSLNNNRAILHVAGGHSNVAAVKLYQKFGFVSVPAGGIFNKPDRDLFVLGNIGAALQSLAWNECLATPDNERAALTESGENKDKIVEERGIEGC